MSSSHDLQRSSASTDLEDIVGAGHDRGESTSGVGIRESVRRRYARAAREASESATTSCCGTVSCKGPISDELYGAAELDGVPEGALLASLGCGNPAALADLRDGEVVLDLGSGGGIDVLMSARRVGPRGKAYGLDMTDEMLELARRNQAEAGVTNAEFLKGHIEDIPLPDESVDVIISNCVINLSSDKDRVFTEAYRVLRSGGRFAVADIVVQGDIPEEVRQNMELWSACQAGALQEEEYREKLRVAGFTDIEVEIVRVYGNEEIRELDPEFEKESASFSEGRFCSAFIRARRR